MCSLTGRRTRQHVRVFVDSVSSGLCVVGCVLWVVLCDEGGRKKAGLCSFGRIKGLLRKSQNLEQAATQLWQQDSTRRPRSEVRVGCPKRCQNCRELSDKFLRSWREVGAKLKVLKKSSQLSVWGG